MFFFFVGRRVNVDNFFRDVWVVVISFLFKEMYNKIYIRFIDFINFLNIKFNIILMLYMG